MKVAGIYLAAGNSRRMGQNKLALPVGNATVGNLALETALKSSLDSLYIITQCKEAHWIKPDLVHNGKCIIVPCTSANKGQSESLRCGIEKAMLENVDAAMIILGDQPFITLQMIEKLINYMKKAQTAKFVAASHNQIIKPPVLFSASMFPALLSLKGDMGAKALLQGELLHQGKVYPFTDEWCFFDIDTKNDYEKFLFMVQT